MLCLPYAFLLTCVVMLIFSVCVENFLYALCVCVCVCCICAFMHVRVCACMCVLLLLLIFCSGTDTYDCQSQQSASITSNTPIISGGCSSGDGRGSFGGRCSGDDKASSKTHSISDSSRQIQGGKHYGGILTTATTSWNSQYHQHRQHSHKHHDRLAAALANFSTPTES